MRDLLGGKGAGLAEMANLGLPVPPGFTITTAVCTQYYANNKRYPDGLRAQVDAALLEIGRITGKGFGDGTNPLLVSVRSGARASMPGMMDTVLNLGLNDETVEALARKSGDPALRLRFLSPLHHDVFRRGARLRPSPLRGNPRRPQGQERLHARHRSVGRRLDRARAALQGAARGGARRAVPAGSAQAAVGRDRRGVRLLDEPARDHLSAPAQHPGKLGHRGQRPGHGVRQHGRRPRRPASPSRAIRRPATSGSTASF